MKLNKRTHEISALASPSSSATTKEPPRLRLLLAFFTVLSAIVLSVMFLPAFGSMHVPYAFADDSGDIKTVPDLEKGKTLDELKSNERMVNNYGTIATNNGAVVTNYGTISSNAKSGTVNDNQGSIGNSLGVVLYNEGTIENYHGYDSTVHVQMLSNSGTINLLASHLKYNEGTIKEASGGWQIGLNDRHATIGTMKNGFVVLDNLGTIDNLASGDVDKNYGTVSKAGGLGRVHNQFYAVNATPSYTGEVPDGIAIEGQDDHALQKNYGNYVLENGTISIVPADGWYIAGYAGLDGKADATLSEDGSRLLLEHVTGKLDMTVRLGKFYDVFVGGTQVTTSNCNDIFGDGSVSYNPVTNVMSFTNAHVDALGTGYAGVYSDHGLKLYFEGDCTIQGDKGHGGIEIKGDTAIIESNDDFSLKILGRGTSTSTAQETVTISGSLTVEDGSISIENSIVAACYTQTDGDVVVEALRDPKTGGVETSVMVLSGGTFTSYGNLGGTRCQLTISGADVVFDCGGTSRWCSNTSSSVVVTPPEGKVTAAVYGTSTANSAKNEARAISGSPFSTTTNITGSVNPSYAPSDAKSAYFATKSGNQYEVAIYDGDELRSTTGTVGDFPFGFAANAPEGYCVDAVSAQTASGTAVEISGPDEDGGYSLTMPKENVTVRFTYKPITYTVAFDGNRPAGASTTLSGETPAQEMAYDTEYPLSGSDFALNGYAFTGWNTKADGSGTPHAAGEPVKNLASEQGAQVTLYAQWEPLTYLVHFGGGGADGSMDPQTFTFDQSAPLSAVAFTYGGHSFQCWKRLAIGATTAYADGETVTNLNESFDADGSPNDATLVAQWLDDSSITITALKDQRPLTGIAGRIALREGDVVFQGDDMFSEASAGVYVHDPTMGSELPEEGTFAVLIDGQDTMRTVVLSPSGSSRPSATVTYYSVLASAEWAAGEDPCSVALTSGAALSGEDCFASGSVVGVSVDTSGIETGYSFDRWIALKADPSGGAWDPQQTQTSFTLSGMTDMLATQRANSYYVEFLGNVPEGCSTAIEGSMMDQKLWYDSETRLTPCEYALPSYIFAGWNTAADGSGTAFADEGSVKNLATEQDATASLYAQWEPITYLIKFDPNGEAGQPYYQTCAYDESAELMASQFTKQGYHLASWNTERDGSGTPYALGATVKNLASEQDAVVTLFAQWEPNVYTVAFDGNRPAGASTSLSGETLAQEMAYDMEYPLSGNGFTLNGYGFTGWNTKADGSGTPYAAGDPVKNLATEQGAVVALYAQWEPLTYLVHFDGGGADGSMGPQELTFDQPAPLDAVAFTREGHSFLGWKRLAIGSSTVYADGETVTNLNESFGADGKPGDATLVAQWLSDQSVSVTALRDGRPLEGIAGRIALREGGTVFQGDGMFSEEFPGVYVHDPAAGSVLPEEGTFEILVDGQDTMQAIVLSPGGSPRPSATVAYYSVLASAEWAEGEGPCSVALASGAKLSGEDCFASGSVVEVSVDTSGIGTGYSFDRWVALRGEPAGGSWDPQRAKTSFGVAGTTDVLATQRANSYYVEFLGNAPEGCSTSVEGSMMDQKLWYDSETRLAPCGYVLPGYGFTGWNTKADGSGTAYADEGAVKNLATEQGAVVALYAQWEPVAYVIGFDPNGGIGQPCFQKCVFDEAAELMDAPFGKRGYHLASWNTARDGSGTSYAPGATVKNLASEQDAVVTLYAQWELGPVSYRFIEGMGSVWTRNSDSPLQFKTNGAYVLFAGVEIDGQPIGQESYTAWSGSTYIELQAPFLQNLSTGEHTITAVYEDGQCSTTFAVKDTGGGIPDTGDSSFLVIGAIAALAAAALIALALAFRKLREKR